MAEPTVLVTGGAGYIGSHCARALIERGYAVVVLDNLSTGFADATAGATLIRGDVGDPSVLERVFSRHRVEAVMHFAGLSEVAESLVQPAAYYANNVGQTVVLLQAMVEHGVKRLVFSSSAAVYGHPQQLPIGETHPRQPINPYGRSKCLVEEMLPDYAHAHGLSSVSLRYFNAAGADPNGELGERHEPETHLIPLVLQLAAGRRKSLAVFGDDYDTPDGSCVRDYIHVDDLARAHCLALHYLEQGGSSRALNLGNGNGCSVLEIIQAAERVTGRSIPYTLHPRREGDPAALLADATQARAILGWQPRYPEIETMVADAWRWECQRGLMW